MRSRGMALLLVVGVVAAACGSRTSSSGTTTSSGSPATSASSGGGPTDPDTPCGPGAARGATDKGVADTSIRIATIEDIGGPRPGLFQGNLDAMNAFVKYCNSLGGVNGRKLVLDAIDSALFNTRPAMQQACDNDFAVVGMAAALDGNAAAPEQACGIPDVAAFTAEIPHRSSPDVVQPLPNGPGSLAVGTERWLASKFPDKAKHTAMMWVGAVSVGPTTAAQRVEGFTKIGWHFDFQAPIAIAETNWGPEIEAFRSKGIGFYEIVSDLTNLVNLEKEVHNQGLTGPVAVSDQSGYDQQLLAQGGAAVEGTYVEATTVPFEEARTSNEMELFLHWLDKARAGATPTALGVQGWSAGLLFATALKSLGSNVTRAALMDALHGIHRWDGHGIHAQSDPGLGKSSPCFITLQVRNGKFARAYPPKGFACDPKNVVTVSVPQ